MPERLSLFAITGGELVRPQGLLTSEPADTSDALLAWELMEKPPLAEYRATLLDIREFEPTDYEAIREWVAEQLRVFGEQVGG